MQLRHLITAQHLAESMASGRVRVVDCRFDLMDSDAGLRAYHAGHIPGAVFADLDRDLSGPVGPDTGRHPLPAAGTLAATFGRLGIDHDTPVVVYDAGNGGLAVRAWWLLRWLGHEQVALLDGGLAAWEQLDLALQPGDETCEPAQFEPRPHDALVMTLDELLHNGSTAEGLNLIDARDAIRFRGESEPIDPVAGHIPGARNLPYSNSLHDDGRWKDERKLRGIWAETLGNDTETPSAVMCGSGVTACHLVLSALLAGYREPRVYIGSWSEWIRDPGRPVASGSA